QGGSGAVARTSRAKLREHVSVKDFGVVGNGTTDDSVNFQKGLDYLDSIGGGVLEIPEGTYRVRNIVLRDNVLMRGVMGRTILKCPDGVDSQIIYNAGGSSGIPLQYVGLEG